MDEVLEDLAEFIQQRVREGQEPANEILENAQHLVYERHGRDDLLIEIKRPTAASLVAHQAEQAGWGPTTDCDRLDSAFEASDAQDIVARQAFSCFNNCGFT